MTKPMVRIHNIETNEVIDREMTDEEYEIYEANHAADQAKKDAELSAQSARAALLERLNITEDEARLLLG